MKQVFQTQYSGRIHGFEFVIAERVLASCRGETCWLRSRSSRAGMVTRWYAANSRLLGTTARMPGFEFAWNVNTRNLEGSRESENIIQATRITKRRTINSEDLGNWCEERTAKSEHHPSLESDSTWITQRSRYPRRETRAGEMWRNTWLTCIPNSFEFREYSPSTS